MEAKKAFTIADLQEKLAEVEAEARKIKRAINVLCDVSGVAPLYQDADFEASKQINVELQGDEYHGKPQATVVTTILETRKKRDKGPISLDELYEEMIAGGHQFKGKTSQIQKRGLAIAMSKNVKFYKLPNEKWGLSEWYPIAKKQKAAIGNQNKEPEIEESRNGDEDNELKD